MVTLPKTYAKYSVYNIHNAGRAHPEKLREIVF